jgi:hypothetical protein
LGNGLSTTRNTDVVLVVINNKTNRSCLLEGLSLIMVCLQNHSVLVTLDKLNIHRFQSKNKCATNLDSVARNHQNKVS